MSAFGAKRKARIIQTSESGEANSSRSDVAPEEATQAQAIPDQAPSALKFTRRPLKQSSLRRSININDDEASGEAGSSVTAGEEEDAPATVVFRPSTSRLGSSKLKKRASSSRLSFGPGEAAAAEDDTDESFTTPRKTLSQRAKGNNALRTPTPLSRLPDRTLDSDDDDRPRYSKEYLDELQSSTPNAPQSLSGMHVVTDDDDMDLDPSELAGAVIVNATDLARADASYAARPGQPTVLSETEIQARKARRARLALEQDAMALDTEGDNDNDADGGGAHYISLQSSSTSNKKKEGSRLIAEDEDLGEGYDEFVEDGGLSLGRKAEHAAAARHRAEMAALIEAAEGGGEGSGSAAGGGGAADDDEEDSSDAERKAAYEAAQTRAGMDGLMRPSDGAGINGHGGDVDAALIIPRIRPLPDLTESLTRMRSLVQGLQDQVAQRQGRIAELEREKAEILSREAEVQEILNTAGQKYQVSLGTTGGIGGAGTSAVDVAKLVSQSPLRPLSGALGLDLPVERGLESFGTTPVRKATDFEE